MPDFQYVVHRSLDGCTEYLFFRSYIKALEQYRYWHSVYNVFKGVDVGLSQIIRIV